MDARPIGIFDSGLGGLTAVKEFNRILPAEDVIYFGDTGRVPYGTRSDETILKYVRQDIRFLMSHDIKGIIIACGTASSVALDIVLREFDIPIVGVVKPAAEAALRVTRNKKVGVIGTPGTIHSRSYEKILNRLNPEVQVYLQACPMFVPLVENGYLRSEATNIIAREYLLPLKEQGIDTLILGCTHYPLLYETISAIMGSEVKLIDSGSVTADAVKHEMEEAGLLADGEKKGKNKYYVTDAVEQFEALGSLFLEKEIDGQVEKTNIEEW